MEHQNLSNTDLSANVGWVMLTTCTLTVTIGIYSLEGILATSALLKKIWTLLYGN